MNRYFLRQDTETIRLREQETSTTNLSNLEQFVITSHNSLHRPVLSDLEVSLQTNFKSGLTETEAKKRLSFFKPNIPNHQPENIFLSSFSYSNYFMLFYVIQSFSALLLSLFSKNYTSNSLLPHIFTFLSLLFLLLVSFRTSLNLHLLWLTSLAKKKLRTVLVTREGLKYNIDSKNIVIGDIIHLVNDCKVPADIRIISSKNCRVDKQNVIGENIPRILDPTSSAQYMVNSRNIALQSIFCTEGYGTGVVIATGKFTFMRKIKVGLQFYKKLPPSEIKELTTQEKFITVIAFIFNIAILSSTQYFEFFSMSYALQFSSVLAISLLVTESTKASRFELLDHLFQSQDKQQSEVESINIDTFEDLEATQILLFDGMKGILALRQEIIKHIYYNGTSFDPLSVFNKNSPCFRDLASITMLCEQEDDKQIFKDYFGFSPKKVIARRRRGRLCFKQYKGNQKYTVAIVHDEQFISDGNMTQKSHYSLYIRSSPDFLLSICKNIQEENPVDFTILRRKMTNKLTEELKSQILLYKKQAERVFALAKKSLPCDRYPRSFDFTNSSDFFGVELSQLDFIGFISCGLIFKEGINQEIQTLRNVQHINPILSSTDNEIISLAAAIEVGLIPEYDSNNISIQNSNINVTYLDAINQAQAVVISDIRLEEAMRQAQTTHERDNFIHNLISSKNCSVFASFSFLKTSRLLELCKKLSRSRNNYNPEKVVAVIGSCVNNRQLLRHTDIGVFIAPDIDEQKHSIQKYDFQRKYAGIVLSQKSGLKKLVQLIDASRKLKVILIYKIRAAMVIAFVVTIPLVSHLIFHIPLPLNFMNIAAFLRITTLDYSAKEESFFSNSKQVVDRAEKYREQIYNIQTSIMRRSRRFLSEGFFDGFEVARIMLSSIVGFSGYFYTMSSFGFPNASLIGLTRTAAFFSNGSQPSSIDPYYFSTLQGFSHCTMANQKQLSTIMIDWHGEFDKDYRIDLRTVFLKCDTMTGNWIPSIQWGGCSVEQTICYRQEVVLWSQTAYFACITIFIIISSIRFDKYKPIKLTLKIIQIFVTICLIYIPKVSEIINAKPINPIILVFPLIAVAFLALITFTVRSIKTVKGRQ